MFDLSGFQGFLNKKNNDPPLFGIIESATTPKSKGKDVIV